MSQASSRKIPGSHCYVKEEEKQFSSCEVDSRLLKGLALCEIALLGGVKPKRGGAAGAPEIQAAPLFTTRAHWRQAALAPRGLTIATLCGFRLSIQALQIIVSLAIRTPEGAVKVFKAPSQTPSLFLLSQSSNLASPDHNNEAIQLLLSPFALSRPPSSPLLQKLQGDRK